MYYNILGRLGFGLSRELWLVEVGVYLNKLGYGAVLPFEVIYLHEGRGFGLETLGLAVDTLRQRGARRVGLSTHRSNRRSQRLYERFGFQRTSAHDYRLFGAWCRTEEHA